MNVVIVSPTDHASRSPTGLGAYACARAYGDAGHRVRMVCGQSQSPRPGHAFEDAIEIMRVPTRRGSPPEAFAIAAAQRVERLLASNRCDVVVVCDAPACVVAIAAVRSRCSSPMLPLIAMEIDAIERERSLLSWPVADAAIALNAHSGFPIIDGIWTPPTSNVPAFVACDAMTESEQAFITSAYAQSGVGSLGWSIAVFDSDGRWSFTEGDSVAAQALGQQAITVSMRDAAPFAAVSGAQCGHASIARKATDLAHMLLPEMTWASTTDALAGAMRRAAMMRIPERSQCAKAIVDHDTKSNHTPSVIAAHERVWSTCRPVFNPQNMRSAWQALECRLVET